MTAEREQCKRLSFTSLLAFAAILMAVYVLAPGPVIALVERGYIAEDGAWRKPFSVVFWPTNWCYQNLDWFKSAYESYLDLWRRIIQ